jgi:hypothetical protein
LEKAKYGFVFCLLGSDRPIYESFAPTLIDQKNAMEKQFAGMSDYPFTYEEYEATRLKLINDVRTVMTEEDKRFLVSFEKGTPAWDDFPYAEFAEYPSVMWKLQNLIKLKRTNPKKLEMEAEKLNEILSK